MRASAFLLVFVLAAGSGHAEVAADLVRAAEKQIGVTTIYDGSYVRLPYPGGDVPVQRGVCTDVIIRAFREIGVDLQKEVHEDMKANFRKYPGLWGLKRPDRNIDHRRVFNLMRYFQRKGKAVSGPFQPGDIVTFRLPSGVPHIGIVDQRQFVVHNIGSGTKSEDILEEFPVTGHYRW